MREPRFGYTDADAVAYSQLPVDELREILSRDVQPEGALDHYDRDFRRRYAAILLRERGF